MGGTDMPRASKQAARETSRAIGRARKQAARTAVAQGESIRASLLLSETRSETEGKDALSNLRRLRGGKLRDGDEVIIARRLYGEVQNLKKRLRARNILLRDFCSLIGIDLSGSSKELFRLTLAPDQTPASVRLRRSADKYYSLIQGISEYAQRNINTLADEVLRGTALHPSVHLGAMSESEKLALALQATVDNVDREFGLYEQFMRTAELKAQGVLKGGAQFWPLWGWEYEEEDTRSAYVMRAADPRNAYWEKLEEPDRDYLSYDDDGFPVHQYTGMIQDAAFFYVPHVPIGAIEYANIRRRPIFAKLLPDYERRVQDLLAFWRTVNQESGKSYLESCGQAADEWDDVLQQPFGQLDFHDSGSYGTEFGWLIIYPTRDNSRLMPMLYVSHEEGGPYVLPLNARNLEIMRDAIWLTETEHKSLFDRIKDLLGYRPGEERVLEQGLRRTAPWFSHNPILKAARAQAADLEALDAFCTKLWQEADSRHSRPEEEN